MLVISVFIVRHVTLLYYIKVGGPAWCGRLLFLCSLLLTLFLFVRISYLIFLIAVVSDIALSVCLYFESCLGVWAPVVVTRGRVFSLAFSARSTKCLPFESILRPISLRAVIAWRGSVLVARKHRGSTV